MIKEIPMIKRAGAIQSSLPVLTNDFIVVMSAKRASEADALSMPKGETIAVDCSVQSLDDPTALVAAFAVAGIAEILMKFLFPRSPFHIEPLRA
jgi:hypothetical protein